jgi:hypothetical protein
MALLAVFPQALLHRVMATARGSSLERRRGHERRKIRRTELDALCADIDACQAQINRMEQTIIQLRLALARRNSADRRAT